MRVLVACERSQRVCSAMRSLGHEAYSCDTQPCHEQSKWHLQCNCLDVLDKDWDLIVAFPPCTHLSAAGAMYWPQKQALQKEAIDLVMAIATCNCPRIAIENPVGILSSVWRKPDQIIQPYMFGDRFTKRTCLWLKGLPPLTPTNMVEPEAYWCSSSYRSGPRKDGTRKKNPLRNANPYGRTSQRDITFPGIAKAMAAQWPLPRP